jgi:hypothetical protein
MPNYRVFVERWTCDYGVYEIGAETEYDAQVLAKYKAMDDPEQYDGRNFEYLETQYKAIKAVKIDPPAPQAKKKSGRPKKESSNAS